MLQGVQRFPLLPNENLIVRARVDADLVGFIREGCIHLCFIPHSLQDPQCEVSQDRRLDRRGRRHPPRRLSGSWYGTRDGRPRRCHRTWLRAALERLPTATNRTTARTRGLPASRPCSTIYI